MVFVLTVNYKLIYYVVNKELTTRKEVKVVSRQKLVQTRIEAGKTLQDVADEIGVSKPYYYMIENGKRGLSYELAVKISAVFGKKPDDIFLPDELTKSEQSA